MAIPYETRGLAADGARRQRRGALKAALIIGSIIALFILLSLIRPMPEENVLSDTGRSANGDLAPAASQQTPAGNPTAP